MVPSFQNVLLNQLNGPLTEQGPWKPGKMGMAAEAAHSGAPKEGSGAGGSLEAGLAVETFTILTPDLRPSPGLAPPGFGGNWEPLTLGF